MGPAQASIHWFKPTSTKYSKQIPTAASGYGPIRAAGYPAIPNPDTGPYFRAIYPHDAGYNWGRQNPVARGLGYNQAGNSTGTQTPPYGAERELINYGRPAARVYANYAPGDGPGISGPSKGLGLQPREAIPTARHTIVAQVGYNVTGGNTHAFMPPPDKFRILNLWKVAPPGTAKDTANWQHFTGTTAPAGNG